MIERIDLELVCAKRLRELRKSKGLTLDEVAALSRGAVKAVVLGSYERGTRAISLARLQQIADIYGVDVTYFFTTEKGLGTVLINRITFDLRALRKLASNQKSLTTNFIGSILSARGDWKGEVLSIRASDADLLAMLDGVTRDELRKSLTLSGLLFQRN